MVKAWVRNWWDVHGSCHFRETYTFPPAELWRRWKEKEFSSAAHRSMWWTLRQHRWTERKYPHGPKAMSAAHAIEVQYLLLCTPFICCTALSRTSATLLFAFFTLVWLKPWLDIWSTPSQLSCKRLPIYFFDSNWYSLFWTRNWPNLKRQPVLKQKFISTANLKYKEQGVLVNRIYLPRKQTQARGQNFLLCSWLCVGQPSLCTRTHSCRRQSMCDGGRRVVWVSNTVVDHEEKISSLSGDILC